MKFMRLKVTTNVLIFIILFSCNSRPSWDQDSVQVMPSPSLSFITLETLQFLTTLAECLGSFFCSRTNLEPIKSLPDGTAWWIKVTHQAESAGRFLSDLCWLSSQVISMFLIHHTKFLSWPLHLSLGYFFFCVCFFERHMLNCLLWNCCLGESSLMLCSCFVSYCCAQSCHWIWPAT